MTVVIKRNDLSASALRQAAAQCNDSAQARRALALALILDGKTRADAAESTGMDRQTLRDWVHRYNENGLEGLKNRDNPGGPSRKLSDEQERQLAEWVRQGPDLERHKIVRWRLVDLRNEIARQFGVKLHERSVGKLMARLQFSRVSVRPRHPDQNVVAQEAHKKTSPIWLPLPSLNMPGENQSNCGGKMKLGSDNKAA
jgi:transposase